MYFAHEKLDVYKVAVTVARWAAAAKVDRKNLQEQLVRAADSVVLNVAEGAGHGKGAVRRNHFKIALGSASEVASILDLMNAPEERKHEVRRVGAMLAKMIAA